MVNTGHAGATMQRTLTIAALLVASGCVTAPRTAFKADLNAQLARGDFDAAAQSLEASRANQYGESQAVLYGLDAGAVLHSAHRYQESDALLDAAETKMEELYTKSVSRIAGSFVVNDGTTEYAGEPHERALLHVLRALNHVFIADHDGALVEARKVAQFLQELNDKYQVRGVYRDDAFAQWLASLLFEDDGRLDDARICREKAAEAWNAYAADYGMTPPQLDFVPRSPGDGELVVIHYNGPAPRKESRQIQVAWNQAQALVAATGDGGDAKVQNALTAGLSSDAITFSYPELVHDPHNVDAAVVTVGATSARTVLAEDVVAIAAKSLEQKLPAIKAKSVARALVKFAATKAAQEAARRVGGSTLGMLTGIIGRAASAASETADTRWWSTVPGEIRVARLSAPPGIQTVTVQFVDRAGTVLGTQTLEGVEIVAGARTYVHVRSVF